MRHVWQEDRGFRKNEALNRAILAAHGSYLIFTDGDCVPRSDFVETHLRLAEPDRYLSGGYLKLPSETSAAVIRLGEVTIRTTSDCTGSTLSSRPTSTNSSSQGIGAQASS